MKRIVITKLALLSLIVFAFIACEKPVDPVAPEKPLALTVSKDSVLCLPVYKDLPALELAWTAGTNHGTGSAIAYTLEMDKEGNAFAGGLKWETGRTANRTMVFGHKQLADTLLQTFPEIEEMTYQTFEFRVRAKVLQTGEEQVSPVVKVVIAWYATMLTDLYLIGDATPNGWNMGRATPMVLDMNDFDLFSWTGRMHKGEFKLLATNTDWMPCYVRDSLDANKMVYRQEEEDYPDFKWVIGKAGNYRIEADTKNLTLTVTYLGGEEYSHLYMIGDAAPGGWSWDNLTELSHPEANIFTYEGPLGAGQLKFPTEIKSDWSGEMIYAPTPDCAPAEKGSFEIRTGGDDNKWLISEPGNWSIRINLSDTTISFIKL